MDRVLGLLKRGPDSWYELEVRNPSLSSIEAHVTVSHQACDQSGVKQHCDSVISPGGHQV